MKSRASEDTMIQRRLERLDRLTFFMRDKRVPDSHRRFFGLKNTHLLMIGFFQNSRWRTAWYCLTEAANDSYRNFKVRSELFYWRRILRLTTEQVEQRIERLCE